MPPPSSEAAKFLTTTINAATGEIVDVDDAAGLKAALARVQNTVLEAEAQVVAIVEEEHEAIASTLNTAEELRAQLSSLEALMAAVPCDALRRELEETVLRVPTLRASRDAARAEHARFSLLAEVHELREAFEAAMVEQELGAADKAPARAPRAAAEARGRARIKRRRGATARRADRGDAHAPIATRRPRSPHGRPPRSATASTMKASRRCFTKAAARRHRASSCASALQATCQCSRTRSTSLGSRSGAAAISATR